MNIELPKERNLFFTEYVDQSSIGRLSQSLVDINSDDARLKNIYAAYGLVYNPAPIKLYIDSYGGMCYQCFGLLGIMKASNTHIHTIVTGAAMSCGFLMAISGHKRYAYPTSTLLYHQVSSGCKGKLKDMESDVIEVKRLQKMMEQHVLALTGITKSRLKESYNAKEDWHISAHQALKLKCIDEIL